MKTYQTPNMDVILFVGIDPIAASGPVAFNLDENELPLMSVPQDKA